MWLVCTCSLYLQTYGINQLQTLLLKHVITCKIDSIYTDSHELLPWLETEILKCKKAGLERVTVCNECNVCLYKYFCVFIDISRYNYMV